MSGNGDECEYGDDEYESEDNFVNDDKFTVRVNLESARIPPEFVYSPPPTNIQEMFESDSGLSGVKATAATTIRGVVLPSPPHTYKNIEPTRPLRAQMRGIMKTPEQNFWYHMYSPEPPDVEKDAHKALNESSEDTTNSTDGLSSRKRKKVQRDANWNNHKPKGIEKKRMKTEKGKKRDTFFGDLSSVDLAVYASVQNPFSCDGIERNGITLPEYDAQAVCDLMQNNRCSAAKAASELGFEHRGAIQTLPPEAFSVYDRNGIRLIYFLPNCFGKSAKETRFQNYFQELLALFAAVKLSTCQADANGRGSGYVFEEGRYTGCVNMAYAWVALMRKDQLINWAIQGRGSHGIQTNESFWAYLKMSTRVRQGIPAAAAVAVHEPAVSSGKSIIKEHPAGWSLLAIFGTCKTGMLSIPRLGIRFHNLPGTLVLLRGRLLEHEVVEWDGKDYRICVAHFTHKDEWVFANVAPPL
ncbi:hypothetical protein B0J17DRAFT_632155 [Rhizoctonia solani]|nr:hypothetical protein B0J17DRAFT_632155 [Rhizoctonia solani]